MSNEQIVLGRKFLKELLTLRAEKGEMTLEDVGGMLQQLSSKLNSEDHIHKEIGLLAAYIADAKKEIFAMTTNSKDEKVLLDASQQLDEVIKATESASNTIMDAADTIQGLAAALPSDQQQSLQDATNRIYEACNFQDITGQRITKVIKLLAHIEERINSLNTLFDDEDQSAPSAVVVPISDKDLLNGPQLAAKAPSQSDIDQLFASIGTKN